MAKKAIEGLKRGRIGPDELTKIKEFAKDHKPDETATHFNRSQAVIEKAISGKANVPVIRKARYLKDVIAQAGGGVDAHIRQIVKQEVALALQGLRIVSE
jgi:hypothetical protein